MSQITRLVRNWSSWMLLTVAVVWPAGASAQLDPLLMVKRNQPNVIFAVDMSIRMLKDADNNYYDPNTYTKTGALWEGSPGLGVTNTTTLYRRIYNNLVNTDLGTSGSDKFTADSITVVGDQLSTYSTFWSKSRREVARLGLLQAVKDNKSVVRFGLIKTRQNSPTWGTEKNDDPVVLPAANLAQKAPTEMTSDFKWKITRPTVGSSNGAITSVQPALILADASGASAAVQTKLELGVGASGGLIPAGRNAKSILDSPIDYILKDAKAEATRLIGADGTNCRNTIVVLVTGGGEGQSVLTANPEGTATEFLSFSGTPNRRVPVYVIAIAPPTASEVTQLQKIASNSGGQYFEITKAMIDATPGGKPVAELVRAANVAIQHAFVDFADCNAAPTPTLPFGRQTEFQITSPVVGSVELEGLKDITGNSLPNDKIEKVPATVPPTPVPQNSNVMLTTAFALPGFEGKLRAMRVYKPVLDDTKISGWRFEKDGTKLWVASAPAAPSRNIYTVTPFGTVVAFDSTNASTLATYMNTTEPDATRTIEYVRGLPLGPFVSSTPAIMNPPSIDPAPDSDYPGFIAKYSDRRTLIWIGGNDGMMHAIDARTGIEVFAFIPFNLLPKLYTLLDGQAVGNLDYFVDASPKLADVRVSNSVATCPSAMSTCWRTYLFFGEGSGGTFFQALDVTLDDMSPAVSPIGPVADVLAYFSSPGRVIFRWSFPSYQDFDYTLAPYGDIKASAPAIAKSVGETWSDPAVGQIKDSTGKFALLTGSGFFPKSRQDAVNRGGAIAGTTFYLLNVDDGSVFHSKDVGSDGQAEDVDNCVTAGNCGKFKNALQADVVATGPADTRFVTKGYIGDLDGNVWRFDLDKVAGVPQITGTTKLHAGGAAHPLFASMATVHIGATQSYVFFGTGSDLLPSTGLPTTHQYKLVSLLDQGSSGSVKYTELLQKIDGTGNDEKVTGFPAVAGDIVFFVTTLQKPSTPCVMPDAAVYAATFTGGQAYLPVGTNAGKAILTLTGARVTAPFIVDQHVAFGFGNNLELLGDPKDFNNGVGQVGVRILSWRDVR